MIKDVESICPKSSVVPQHASHITERLVDGELVLYDSKRQCLHALNPSAALVWLQCDGKHDQASIVAALIERYPGSRAQIEQDVPEVLSLFATQGLLKS